MDIFSKDERSRMMSKVRGANTKPERLLRSALHKLGFRFRIQRKDLPGKPDIVLPKYKAVILVHGCFWHQHPGCKLAAMPQTNVDFWKTKLEGNAVRDRLTKEKLEALGWRVIIVWGCEVKGLIKNPEKLAEMVTGSSGKG